jgi:DNA-binding beta-propeller fold protein YncE
VYVFDIDDGFRLVKHVELPGIRAIRGVAASPFAQKLFISYGGSGGKHGNGSMLRYDLPTDRIDWMQHYDTGIDSMAVTEDGSRIYMPTGEQSDDDRWLVIDGGNGAVMSAIRAAPASHNTVVGPGGTNLYLAAKGSNFLLVANTRTNQVEKKVGPLKYGVRPFTVNGRETLAFTTATGFLGFQVSDLRSGKLLYTIDVDGFHDCHLPRLGPLRRPLRLALSRFFEVCEFIPSAPSHGVSLSPDETELYLMDTPNSYVHVYDVAGLPDHPPRKVADIKLRSMKEPVRRCEYDCAREGWLIHSADGRYVFVGESGDVIETSSRRIVANLEPLSETRKFIQINWKDGRPVFTTTRHGLGYVSDAGAHRGGLR